MLMSLKNAALMSVFGFMVLSIFLFVQHEIHTLHLEHNNALSDKFLRSRFSTYIQLNKIANYSLFESNSFNPEAILIRVENANSEKVVEPEKSNDTLSVTVEKEAIDSLQLEQEIEIRKALQVNAVNENNSIKTE